MTIHRYFVYILTNPGNSVLYIGVTNSLKRRAFEHKQKLIEGFTKRYNLVKLVYFEEATQIDDAIRREKQLKGWVRRRKDELISSTNPTRIDLAADWF